MGTGAAVRARLSSAGADDLRIGQYVHDSDDQQRLQRTEDEAHRNSVQPYPRTGKVDEDHVTAFADTRHDIGYADETSGSKIVSPSAS